MSRLQQALVSAFSEPEQLSAFHRGQSLRARAGQTLFHQMDPADAVYLLIEGLARCFVSSPSEESGQWNSLFLQAPAAFGDRDLLSRLPAGESVECLTPCRFLLWPAEAFVREWNQAPLLRELLGKDLASRYAQTLALRQLEVLPLSQRLALLLQELSSKSLLGKPSQATLALLLNTSLKPINRALAFLRREAVVSEIDDGFTVDSARLAALGAPEEVRFFHQLEGRSRTAPVLNE